MKRISNESSERKLKKSTQIGSEFPKKCNSQANIAVFDNI
jgi:hypothetical protein